MLFRKKKEVKEKKTCRDCQFGDYDYIYDDVRGYEAEVFWCAARGMCKETDAQNCTYYEKRKPVVYHEEDTMCDKCEYLSVCILDSFDCTTLEDTRKHIVCNQFNCKKKAKYGK